MRNPIVLLVTLLSLFTMTVGPGCGSSVDTDDDGTASGAGANGPGVGGAGGASATGGTGGVISPCPSIAPDLQAVLEGAVEPTAPGGFVIGVASPTCPGWHGSQPGIHEVPKDGLYKMGTLSELLVAATIMKLVEDGELSLADTLDSWQPGVPNASSITLRMLLNHSAGLANHFTSPDFSSTLQADPQHVFTPQELVGFATGLPATTPGGPYASEFIHTVLLGLVIEQVTSQAAHVAIRQRIIEPLGLTSVGLGGVEVDTADLVPGYSGLGAELTNVLHPSAWWVSASYVSTVPDMVALVRGVLGTDEVLSAASREAMTDMAIPTGFPLFHSGLGVLIDNEASPDIVGQEGALPGYELRAYYAEAIDAGIVIMSTNQDAKTRAPLLQVLSALNQPL